METIVSGHCNRCGKVWTLEKGQGVCQWCGKPATCQSSTTKPRSIKSSLKHRQRQVDGNGNGNGNGYDQLKGEWLTYYKVASRFSHKALIQDREDLLHTIITTLADVERNSGHKPFTETSMYRIASHTVADYWRERYRLVNGLDCRWCSKAQRHNCRKHSLYCECPKAIKIESVYKPITDSEGNTTELGELIADDTAIDLDTWLDYKTFLAGMPKRLIAIAVKRRDGITLDPKDQEYLRRFRVREQINLF